MVVSLTGLKPRTSWVDYLGEITYVKIRTVEINRCAMIRFVYQYNAYNEDLFTITGTEPLPAGKVVIEAKYTASEDKKSGTVILNVNGKEVGAGEVKKTVPGTYSLTETFDVGQDTGTQVSKDYDRENEFTGTLDKVVFNLE